MMHQISSLTPNWYEVIQPCNMGHVTSIFGVVKGHGPYVSAYQAILSKCFNSWYMAVDTEADKNANIDAKGIPIVPNFFVEAN